MKQPASAILKKGSAYCSKFDGCNAPICPLGDYLRGRHLPGERVCLWLREAVKPGGMARITQAATEQVATAVAEALPAIIASSGADLRHKLAEASRCGSKLKNAHAMREQMTQIEDVAHASTSNSEIQTAISPAGDIGGDHGKR
jgi:hypothetical protein